VGDRGAPRLRLVPRAEPAASSGLRPATGGCCDGLHEDRLNENQGAESTLSFLLALLEMRAAAQLPRAERVAALKVPRRESANEVVS
jgi:hypothetical protein